MVKGERMVFESADLSLICRKGILWITWPGSDDVILAENMTIHIVSKGKICISSFAESDIEVVSLKKTGMFKQRYGKTKPAASAAAAFALKKARV